MNPTEQTATVEFQVIDAFGRDVGSDVPAITLAPNNMRKVLRRESDLTGTLDTSIPRSVLITSTEELWILAIKGAGGESRVTVPVYSRVVPTPTEKDDDSCPGGAKTC